ncbi:hypothetical protein ACFLQ2_01090 [archaeon]
MRLEEAHRPADKVEALLAVKKGPMSNDYHEVNKLLSGKEDSMVRLNAFRTMLVVPHPSAPLSLVEALEEEKEPKILERMCRALIPYSGEHMGGIVTEFASLTPEARDKIKELLKKHNAPEDHPLLVDLIVPKEEPKETPKEEPKENPKTNLDDLFKPF